MFDRSIPYYDRLYAAKDYEGEARRIVALVRGALGPGRLRLLDVACGTGRHLRHLAPHFDAEGLELLPAFLDVARKANPLLAFHEGDMRDFDLGRRFDVLTCLFSSIGYMQTLAELDQVARTFARHVVPGGLALVEPWFTPGAWHARTVHASYVDEPDLKIARLSTSFQDGRLSFFDLHHLVATPEGTEHFVERHEMGLFETDELLDAFSRAGFEARYDPEGLTGRGLLVATRGEAGGA